MDELEEIRQRRLRELQAQQAGQDPGAEAARAAEEAAEQEAAIESILLQVLTPEARERLTRIRMSRPDRAAAITQQLLALVQSGRLDRQLTDADLRAILAQTQAPERDIKITRK